MRDPKFDASEHPTDGCDCTELCSMGPTCPGGGLAGLPGSGCWRVNEPESCNECGLLIDPDDAAPSCGAHLLHTHCAPWFHCTACYRARTEDVL